jgi:uncharacterized membrane protein
MINYFLIIIAGAICWIKYCIMFHVIIIIIIIIIILLFSGHYYISTRISITANFSFLLCL